jgi:hypothetical protein
MMKVNSGRNFYTPTAANPISGGAEVWLGYYQSLRLAQVSSATHACLTLALVMCQQFMAQACCPNEQLQFTQRHTQQAHLHRVLELYT